MEEWMKRSWFFQQAMNEQIGDRCWDVLERNEEVTSKIDYAFIICYGSHYKREEKIRNVFNNVNKKVLSYYDGHKSMRFSCTLVNLWLNDGRGEGIYCVFWLKKGTYDTGVCIDRDSRTYENWKSFIENNLLPQCYIMYPRGGKYALDCGEFQEYIDVVCEKSNACRTWKLAKYYCNLVSTVMVSTGIAVLILNPITTSVSIGALAATVTGGAVSTFCAADRLLDIRRYERIDMTEARSLFAVADVVFSMTGTLAVGVTAGCQLLHTNLAGSALAFKLANSTAYVCKIVSNVSSVRFFIEIIFKYKTGSLAELDYKDLGAMLLFSFNVYVLAPLLYRLVEHMGHCDLYKIATHLMRIKSKIVEFGMPVREITDFNELLEFILPAELPFLKKISNHELIKTIFKKFDNFSEKELQNPVALMYSIISELPSICKSIDEYFNRSQEDMRQHYDESTCNKILTWTSSDGLDWNDSNFSSYDCKINIPIDIKNKVVETLKSLSRGRTKKAALLQKTDLLYHSLLEMVSKHPMKSYAYVIDKVNYFCEVFKNIFSRIIDRHYFEYFLFTTKNGFENDRNDFFMYKMLVPESVLYTVFSESLNFLHENLDDLHLSCEREVPEFDTVSDKVIHKFQVPEDTELNQDFYYSTAAKCMPNMMFVKENMEFERCFDDSLAIMMSVDFKLLFYTYKSDNSLNGLLIYIKNINSDESV